MATFSPQRLVSKDFMAIFSPQRLVSKDFMAIFMGHRYSLRGGLNPVFLVVGIHTLLLLATTEQTLVRVASLGQLLVLGVTDAIADYAIGGVTMGRRDG